MRLTRLLIALLLLTVLHSAACAPKSYPRRTTARERFFTSTARFVDLVGAEVIPRYKTGRRYDLTRQTPEVEYSYYMDLRFRRNPALFYQDIEGMPDVQVADTLDKSRSTVITLIKWHSQYVPQNPDFALRYETYEEDHTAWAVYLKSKRPVNKGVIIVTHPWGRGDIDVRRNYKHKQMMEFLDVGYDVVVLQEPYHGLRSLENTVFSGEQFYSGEIAMIDEAMCQAVADIRSMMRWLRPQYEVVGLWGKGMGATAAMMTAVVDDSMDFVVAWSPVGMPGSVPPSSPMAPFAVKTMRAAGLDQITVDKVLYVVSPANYFPKIPVKDTIVFAGMGDVFITPDQPGSLESKWDNIDIVWFAGGHLISFQKKVCGKIEDKFLTSYFPKPEEVKPEKKSKRSKEMKKEKRQEKKAQKKKMKQEKAAEKQAEKQAKKERKKAGKKKEKQ